MNATWLYDDDPLWTNLPAEMEHDVYHLPGYVRAAARIDEGHPAAFYASEGSQRLLLPLLIRQIPIALPDGTLWRDACSPYGYPGPALSGPSEGRETFVLRALEVLRAALRDRDMVSCFVRLHPLLSAPTSPFQQIGSLVHHGDTAAIDLRLSLDTLWNQTRASSRNEINQARRAGLTASMDSRPESLAVFRKIYAETMQRVQARPYYLFGDAFFQELQESLGARLQVCLVRDGDETACAGLFTEVNGIVQYFLSGTNGASLRLHPSKFMLDYVRTWAKKRGNRMLHLGGGRGGVEDALFFFKSGFSPMRCPFFTWRCIAHPEMYQALVQQRFLSGGSARESQGFFPAYRTPPEDA